jgi:hypothetical protein
VKDRSYIGDGVYASYNGHSVLIELENGRPIELNKDVFHALVEFVHRQKVEFDPNCQLVEIPSQCFKQVVQELRELESVADRGGTKLQ